jgi:protein TonB
MHVQHAAIPESMRNSPPIAPPVVVTVSPAQMMPVSASQSQLATPTGTEQFSEPVSISEDAERALLVHTVNPVYPPEAAAQKLHGAVVLQARVGRDGNVEDLKIVRGYFVLGKAAIAAVKQWHFQPYTLNGHPAATQTQITINFTYPPG